MWIVFVVTLLAVLVYRPASGRERGSRLLKRTGPRWRRMYSRRNFLRLGAGLVGAGALAYSGADEACESWYSDHVDSAAADQLARLVEPWGRRFWFVNWLLLAILDVTYHSSALTRWGRRNWEAMLVGLPTLWGVQYGLGAARPTDNSHGPRWKPLADENTASGHAFMAAIPWLTAAKTAGRGWARAAAGVGSTLTGWSRFHDRRHYLSQVLLGWGIAWTAVDAVGSQPPESDAGTDSGVSASSGTRPKVQPSRPAADRGRFGIHFPRYDSLDQCHPPAPHSVRSVDLIDVDPRG